MNELVRTCGMACFVIGIARRHFLADKRTVGYFELFLEFTVEEAEHRVVIPIIIAVHIVNVTIINTVHKVCTKFLVFAFRLIIGVETDWASGVDAAHLLHYIRNNAVFFFSAFQVAVIVVELHFIIYCPEE